WILQGQGNPEQLHVFQQLGRKDWMEHPRQVRRAARNQTQRALLVERLKPVEQLAGNFQIEIDSEPNADQFVDFTRSADGESARADARECEVGFFPHCNAAESAPMKFFVALRRPNDL